FYPDFNSTPVFLTELSTNKTSDKTFFVQKIMLNQINQNFLMCFGDEFKFPHFVFYFPMTTILVSTIFGQFITDFINSETLAAGIIFLLFYTQFWFYLFVDLIVFLFQSEN